MTEKEWNTMNNTTKNFTDLLKREAETLRKQADQPSLTEKRIIAEKSFMLGVNWLLKLLTQHQDLWNVDDNDAKILSAKAEKIVSQFVYKGGN